MNISAQPVGVTEISLWRDLYRNEMNCQIIHDNMHARGGWTQPYRIEIEGVPAGYGSILVGGPWKETRTAFDYYLESGYRSRAFDCFEKFLAASQATAITAQTNDALLTVMLHLWGRNVASESIVFRDSLVTTHRREGAVLRQRSEPEQDWVIEMDGAVVANGGILYHYNPPYGDIYMEVAEGHRRRGIGCYLVQELKRICYEGGNIPCARCNPGNVASRKTLQKAGFVPCAHLLNATL
jgi:GNAT superfamily N-acetyltransferase